MPYRNGNKVWNATEWSEQMIAYLQENFHSRTNKELADHLGVTLTVTRNKCRELGLKRMELEYWTKEMVQYLRDNYRQMGDVEIMDYFKEKYPKAKGWTRGAIWKKRKQLGLSRTEEEKEELVKKHCSPGGRSYTIERNSSSRNMHDGWVANLIAWRDPELREEVLKHKNLIEVKRQQIILKRVIHDSTTNSNQA